jgi:transglutaminase-like putative cysteine protease
MAPEASRFVHQVTFVLLLLACAATEIAAVDGRSIPVSLVLATVWIAFAVGLGRLVPAPKDERGMPPRWVLLALLCLAGVPFFLEPVRRRLAGMGYPLELQMVFALRNLGLGLAACASWRLCLRLACIVSLFLMLFAIAMTDHPAVLTLLGLYTAAGSVWLMAVYWTGLQRFFVQESPLAVEIQSEGRRLPWLTVFVAVALVGCVLGLVAFAPQHSARVLGQWLPTSGGTGDYDPFARGGTNDGDDEVQGQNARSTGMVLSDTFLDSPLPTLYDMLSDMYGEPFKPKDQERAMALDRQTTAGESKKPPADNLRPNREFPTTRNSPRRPRESTDRAARALFEVQGRTPLHVRATAYDVFDGVAWQEAPLNLATCSLEKEPKSNWMRVQERQPPAVFALAETHQFKITSSLGIWLPTPPHLTRFRVGRVDQAGFFAWGPDRILRMAQRKTPAGIVVETECRTVDPRKLEDVSFLGLGREPFFYGAVPADLNSEVSALAQRWADEQPQGWRQMAAILQHLRAEYTLDPAARVPDDCHDPLGHFLLRAKRGPDYQFATAAAVLLRVLGCQTRLVNGFYVAPEHYDPLTRHTPVVQEDLHFWTEVLLPCGEWLVLEPTPGYEVMGPNQPLSERIFSACAALASWAWQQVAPLSVGAIMLVGAWWRRRELLDLSLRIFWRWFPGPSWQQCVRRALWLLEWRGRCAGRPRRASQTVQLWLRTTLPEPISQDTELEQLTRMAEWAAYAADLAPPWQRTEVDNICRHVVHDWTLRRWRSVAR